MEKNKFSDTGRVDLMKLSKSMKVPSTVPGAWVIDDQELVNLCSRSPLGFPSASFIKALLRIFKFMLIRILVVALGNGSVSSKMQLREQKSGRFWPFRFSWNIQCLFWHLSFWLSVICHLWVLQWISESH